MALGAVFAETAAMDVVNPMAVDTFPRSQFPSLIGMTGDAGFALMGSRQGEFRGRMIKTEILPFCLLMAFFAVVP